MRISNYRLAMILAAGAVGGGTLAAKDKHPKPDAKAQDQIEVESHLTVGDGPVTRFITTQHYDRAYVYAEHEAGKPVTLIDVTDRRHPRVLSNASSLAPSGNLLAVAGTAALVGGEPVAAAPAAQTIKLMDFSDPANPKVTRQFEGVTAISRVGGGMILLANADGIWVLSEKIAEDPAVEKRYANKVIYGESMY